METYKLNHVDVRARVADHPAKQIADLLPWNWAVDRAAALTDPLTPVVLAGCLLTTRVLNFFL